MNEGLAIALSIGIAANFIVLIRVRQLLRLAVHTNHTANVDIFRELMAVRQEIENHNRESVTAFIGREWHTEWPRHLAKSEVETILNPYSHIGTPRFPNPAPFESADAYTKHLLVQKYVACDPLKRVKLLQSLSSIPHDLEVRAMTDQCEFVRMWMAAHMELPIYEEESGQTVASNPPEADSSQFVRAALLCNPDFPTLPWKTHIPVLLHDDWKERLKNYTTIECFALMYNPKLSIKFLLELMRNTAQTLGVNTEVQEQMICIGLRNPDIIEWSRRHGRKWWSGYDGEPFAPDEQCAEIWSLAFSVWWDSNISRLASLYIQTTPEKKLEIYKSLEAAQRDPSHRWRLAILRGCMMPDDKEILQLGLQGQESCREEARRKIESWKKRRFEIAND